MKYNAPFKDPTTALKYFPDERGVKDAFSPHSLLEKYKSGRTPLAFRGRLHPERLPQKGARRAGSSLGHQGL